MTYEIPLSVVKMFILFVTAASPRPATFSSFYHKNGRGTTLCRDFCIRMGFASGSGLRSIQSICIFATSVSLHLGFAAFSAENDARLGGKPQIAAEADALRYSLSVSSATSVSLHLGFAAFSAGNGARPGGKTQIAAEVDALRCGCTTSSAIIPCSPAASPPMPAVRTGIRCESPAPIPPGWGRRGRCADFCPWDRIRRDRWRRPR